MPTYKDIAKQMVEDYIYLEELTVNNNKKIPSVALGEKYNIDKSGASELWRGVRMGILQSSDETMYGKAAKKMHNDGIVDNIDNMTYKEVDKSYNVKGNAGMHILLGLKAVKLYYNKNITKADSYIPDNIKAEHIKLAAIDFNNDTVKHLFKHSTTYDVIIDGNRYPPKAIIGLASRHILGEPLTPAHFGGGLGTKCFRILGDNGFLIVLKSDDIIYPDEILKDEVHNEGAKKEIIVNSYERNDKARLKCIEHYGLKCSVCNFDFNKIYGDIGSGFIHVHHVKLISSIGEEYIIDPIKDLRPVCPNCHAMLHKRREPYSIDELKNIMKIKANK